VQKVEQATGGQSGPAVIDTLKPKLNEANDVILPLVPGDKLLPIVN